MNLPTRMRKALSPLPFMYTPFIAASRRPLALTEEKTTSGYSLRGMLRCDIAVCSPDPRHIDHVHQTLVLHVVLARSLLTTRDYCAAFAEIETIASK